MTSKKGVPIAVAVLVVSAAADAHVVSETTPVFANATSVIEFAIEHRCGGKDTRVLEFDVPPGITGARAMFSDFARPVATTDNANNVTSFTWTKDSGDLLPAAGNNNDYAYYRIVLRFKTPNQPFTILYVPVHQTCTDPGGADTQVEWTDTPSTPQAQQTGNPAPGIKLYPARAPGWNKYTVPAAMTADDLKTWFGDAQIVWKGNAAFSANANTAALIASTPGVTTLSSLSANDEIWVKY